ncbi:MAG: PAS domain S-box protein [Spirochaetes bacterium]|nr:PAS domain S-box protein [Spirochaetota bacterium]
MLIRNKFEVDILIVSSNADIIELKKLILNNISSKILIINSGSEAISYIKNHNADIILLDLDLPDRDSAEVLTLSLKCSPSAQVLIITKEITLKKTIECLNKGAFDYIQRPFNRDIILKRITNSLDKNKILNELEFQVGRYLNLDRQYQNIIQNTNDIIYCLDNEGKFTYVNERVKKILGYDSNQLLGRHYSDIIFPEFADKAGHIFHERRGEHRENGSTRISLKPYADGNSGSSYNKRQITVQVKAKGIYEVVSGNYKKYIGTYGVARDISGFVEIEELLKVQHTYFQELFNNSTEAIAILDNNNYIIDANKSFENLFGYKSEEFKFCNINELILPEDLQTEAECLFDNVFSKGITEKETIRMRKDESRVEVSILAYPIKFENDYIGMMAIYRDLTGANGSQKEHQATLAKLRKTMNGIVHAMVSTVEVRDPYTAGHQERVSNLARLIAQELNLGGDEIEGIRVAGTLHDLGKVNIPAEILSRPGRLTDIEFSLIKRHPEIAYKVLQNIDIPWPIAEIVYQHHERLDGSGYPLGLKGEDIRPAARILTVADVVEAIASHRPYRPALGVEKALCEITMNSGILYDSKVVDACVKVIKEEKFFL